MTVDQHPARSFAFPANPSSIGEARMAIARFAHEAGFDSETVSEITVAAGEACNVAVDSATPQAEFRVGCVLEDANLLVSVDYDIGRVLPSPQLLNPVPIDGVDMRGLGALLLTKLMDSVDYEHSVDSHARLVLKKSRCFKGAV